MEIEGDPEDFLDEIEYHNHEEDKDDYFADYEKSRKHGGLS